MQYATLCDLRSKLQNMLLNHEHTEVIKYANSFTNEPTHPPKPTIHLPLQTLYSKVIPTSNQFSSHSALPITNYIIQNHTPCQGAEKAPISSSISD